MKKILILIFLLFFISFISAENQYQDCEIYGNCKPIVTAVTFNNNTGAVNTSEFANCWITSEGIKCDVSDITYDEISAGDVNALGYTGFFNYIQGVVGQLSIDGSPWYLGGTDLELGSELTVDGFSHLNNTYPRATLEYDLGSGALRWRRIYVQNISFENADGYNLELSENLTIGDLALSGSDGVINWNDGSTTLTYSKLAGIIDTLTFSGLDILDLGVSGLITTGGIVGNSFTIGANSLTTSEFGYLDGQDQGVRTTDSPTFQSPVTSTNTGAGAGYVSERTDGSAGLLSAGGMGMYFAVDKNFPMLFVQDDRSDVLAGVLASPTIAFGVNNVSGSVGAEQTNSVLYFDKGNADLKIMSIQSADTENFNVMSNLAGVGDGNTLSINSDSFGRILDFTRTTGKSIFYGDLNISGNIGIGMKPTNKLDIKLNESNSAGIKIDGTTVPQTTPSNYAGVNNQRTISIPANGLGYSHYGFYNSLTDNHGINGGFILFPVNVGQFNTVTNNAPHSASGTFLFNEENYGLNNAILRIGTITATGLNMINYGQKNQITSSFTFNSAGNSLSETNYASYNKIISTPILTAGSLTRNLYGTYSTVEGSTVGTSTAYADFVTITSASDTNWLYYAGGTIGNNYLGGNNIKTYFGTSLNTAIWGNVTGLYLNPKEVGAGKVYVQGDLNVKNNFTGNQIYGGAYYSNNTATTLNFAIASTLYNLFLTNATDLNGFIFKGGFKKISNLTAQISGKYQVVYNAVGDGQNNHHYITVIVVNSIPKGECSSHKKISAGGDIITMTSNCIISINTGDVVSLEVMDYGGTGTGNYYQANINLHRIGGI